MSSYPSNSVSSGAAINPSAAVTTSSTGYSFGELGPSLGGQQLSNSASVDYGATGASSSPFGLQNSAMVATYGNLINSYCSNDSSNSLRNLQRISSDLGSNMAAAHAPSGLAGLAAGSTGSSGASDDTSAANWAAYTQQYPGAAAYGSLGWASQPNPMAHSGLGPASMYPAMYNPGMFGPGYGWMGRPAYGLPVVQHHGKKGRMTYQRWQTTDLEAQFVSNRYVTKRQRQELSMRTRLNDRQIKIWFQNRRMKEKKDGKRRKEEEELEASKCASSTNKGTTLPPTQHLSTRTNNSNSNTNTSALPPQQVELQANATGNLLMQETKSAELLQSQSKLNAFGTEQLSFQKQSSFLPYSYHNNRY